MKKRLTVNTLALSSIKTRKKQYILIVVGIIFAMMFSSAILFFGSSMVSSTDEMSRNQNGNCEVMLLYSDRELIDKLCEDKVITDYGNAHIIGYAQTDDCEDGHGMTIAYLDEKAKDMSYISFLEGGYPENDGEIALEKATLARLRIADAQIGDTITLNFYNQNGNQLEQEPVTKSYKLVGIARNKLVNIIRYYSEKQQYIKKIPSAFVYQGADTDLGGKETLCCYANYNHNFKYGEHTKSSEYWVAIDEYFADMEYDWSNRVEGIRDNYAFYDSDTYTSVLLAIVLVVVLLIASGIGIINTFNTNLKERKKQIGLFRTVGATKHQIINIYGREALFISLVCAPVSVLLSYFLVKGVTRLLGEDFVFVPNIFVLIASGVLGVIFVMLASLVPLVSASRISPIQSIRNIELMRKMKNKKIKSQHQFDTSSLLAKRSLVFHRGKRIVVSVILIFTIILSCYGFSFLDYEKNNQYTNDNDYTIYSGSDGYWSALYNDYDNSGGLSENNRRDILLCPYVDRVWGTKECVAAINIDEFTDYERIISYSSWSDVFENKYWDPDTDAVAEVTKDNVDEIFGGSFTEEYLDFKQKNSVEGELLEVQMGATEGAVLEELKNSVIDGKINVDKINSGEEIILVAPQRVAFHFEPSKQGGYSSGMHINDKIDSKKDYMKQATSHYKAGDMLDISIVLGAFNDNEESVKLISKNDFTVKIGAIISEIPDDFNYSLGGYGEFKILTTNIGMSKFSPETRYKQLNVALKGDCNDDIERDMQELLGNISDMLGSGCYIYSAYGNAKDSEKTMNTLLIAMLAIIILFLSISASIINNSFTAQIREGKREIGTLRAVGASQREIVVSYIKQLFSIFIWGYGIGFVGFGVIYGIAYFVSYMDAKSFGYEFRGLSLSVTLWQTILACVILFAVCAINLSVKIHKEMKNSIIENIREL